MPRYTRACERCKAEFTTNAHYGHSRCIPCRKAKSNSLEVGCVDCGTSIPAGGKRCRACVEVAERERWKAKGEQRKGDTASSQTALVGCEGCGKPTPRGRAGRRHIHCGGCEAFQAAFAKEAWRRPFPDVLKWEAFAAKKAAEAAKAPMMPDANAHVAAWRAWQKREDARAAKENRRAEAKAKRIAERPWLAEPLGYRRIRARLELDPEFVLLVRLHKRMTNRKRARSREAAKTMRNALRADRNVSFRKLGYTAADLKRHLERQFTKRMSWEAFKAGDIHIDHRIPLSAFDLSDPDQYRAAWALTNLQPLWASDNIAKAARRDLLL